MLLTEQNKQHFAATGELFIPGDVEVRELIDLFEELKLDWKDFTVQTCMSARGLGLIVEKRN